MKPVTDANSGPIHHAPQKNMLLSLMRRSDSSVILATIVLFLIFTFSSESFLSSYNMFNVFRNAGLYLFIAMGQAIVLVIGGMNLSLGAIGGLSVVTAGYAMEVMGLPGWVAALLALAIGGLAGLINAICIIKLRLNSFVVTLATSYIFTGLVYGISKGFPYAKIPSSFTFLGRQGFGFIPYLFVLMMITLLVVWYIFKFTIVGRHILATGGNLVAARLSGIKTDRIILLANIASGMFASVAGLLWISRMGSATPATGADWMIISFAVAVIGGTALSGGSISALGLFFSSLMLVLIKNGLIMLGVNVYFEQTFLGLIILLAVTVEAIRYKYNHSLRR